MGIGTDRKKLADIQAEMSKVPDLPIRTSAAAPFGAPELQAFEALVVPRNKPEHEFTDPGLELAGDSSPSARL